MSQPEFEAHYAELKREIEALEEELAHSKARQHFAHVRQRIETLYETLRESHLLLHTILENSAASIYAKRKDGRYIYLNRGMEILCNVTREQCLGRTDVDVFPHRNCRAVSKQRPHRHDDGPPVGIRGDVEDACG